MAHAHVALPLPLPPPFVGAVLPMPAAAAAVRLSQADLACLCEAVHTARIVRRTLGLFTDWLMSLVYHYSHSHGRHPCAPVAMRVNGVAAGSAGFRLMRVSATAKPSAAEIAACFRRTFAATPYAAKHLENLVRRHLQDTCDAILRSGAAPPGSWAKVQKRTTAAPRARRAEPPRKPGVPDTDSDRDTDPEEADEERDRDRHGRLRTDLLAPGAAYGTSSVAKFWLERLRALRETVTRIGAPQRRWLDAYVDSIDGCIKAVRVVLRNDLLRVGSRVKHDDWAATIFPDVAAWKAARTPRYFVTAAGRAPTELLPDPLLWALLLAFDGKRVAERAYDGHNSALVAQLATRFTTTARTSQHAIGPVGTAGPGVVYVGGLRCPLPVSQYQLELLRSHAPAAHAALVAGARPSAAANRPFLAFVSD